jgi:predicted MFS family arabinose efflux permease
MTALGPLAAGVAYDHLIVGAPYWIGAALFTIAALMLLQVRSAAKSAKPVS